MFQRSGDHADGHGLAHTPVGVVSLLRLVALMDWTYNLVRAVGRLG